MKLLIDTHCFDYSTSEGMNTYLRGLYSALVPMARDIEFYFAAQDTEKLRGIFPAAENVHYLQLKQKNKVARLLTEFPQLIRQHQIDCAHYQYTAPLLKNCRTIVTLHDILFMDYPELFPLSYRLSKRLLFGGSAKRADLLLTVSDYSKERIVRHFGIPAERIVVTHNAVSADFHETDKAEAKAFVASKGINKYLLYVSRIEPRKNQEGLVRTYLEMKLAERGYHLVLIGRATIPSPALDELVRQAEREVPGMVHILNQVSYEELKRWYRAADLFVYPALAEGFGIPPIEAGMAETPCICNNRTAMGDFTFFGTNSIDTSDEPLLRRRIAENLRGDGPDTSKIRQAIEQRYNWRQVAEGYYAELKARFMARTAHDRPDNGDNQRISTI